MGAILDALQGLQEVERQVAAIRAKADAKRRKIRFHKRELQKQDAAIEEKNAAIREQQVEIDRIELDIGIRDETLSKHREALNRSKTNKEYAAILTTINLEKADSAKLESRQLQLMTDLDEQRTVVEAVVNEREHIAQRVQRSEEDLQSYLDETAATVAELEQQRERAAEGLSPALLDTFQRVATKHEGEALAGIAVVNSKRNEYACAGCNMSVTLEAVLTLQTRDELQMCPSCGMILYIDEASRLKVKR